MVELELVFKSILTQMRVLSPRLAVELEMDCFLCLTRARPLLSFFHRYLYALDRDDCLLNSFFCWSYAFCLLSTLNSRKFLDGFCSSRSTAALSPLSALA